MASTKKMSEQLYERYEYLAYKYANKMFSYEELSLEYEDLLQEFRIKIFTSIKAYGHRWKKYRKTGRNKPVPIKFYLDAACGNKMRDFMKLITRENHKTRIDEISYDFGISQDSEIDPSRNRFIINGVDLLEGLTGKERMIFSLHIRGYNKNFLNKVYYSKKEEKRAKKDVIDSGDEPFTPQDIIEMQKAKLLAKYGNELLQANHVYETYDFED